MSKIQIANRKSPSSMGLLTCSRDFLISLIFLGGKIMRLGLKWHQHTGFGNVPSLRSHQLTEQKLPTVPPFPPPANTESKTCPQTTQPSYSVRLWKECFTQFNMPGEKDSFSPSLVHSLTHPSTVSKHSAARMPCKILSGHQSGSYLRTSLKWTLLIQTSDRK